MGSPEEPEVYYESDDGEKMPCSLRQAQIWLYQGFFKSDIRFSLRGRDGKMGEWRTLGELFKRNGPQMPFCELDDDGEEFSKKQEKLDELKKRKEELRSTLEKTLERRAYVQEEMQRIMRKFPDETRSLQSPTATNPVTNGDRNSHEVTPNRSKPTAAVNGERRTPDETRSQQPRANSANGEATPPPAAYPPLSPARGVDPFVLLKSCPTARRKMEPDTFVGRLKDLGLRYTRCDKPRLEQQTATVFASFESKWCPLCKVKLATLNVFITHITSQKHIYSMKGQVCEDAFDYWSNAVNEADGARSVFQRPDARPVPAIRTRSPPGFEPKPGYSSQTQNGFSPPPGIDARQRVESKQNFGTGRRSPPAFESRPEPGLRPPPGFDEAKADPAMRSPQGAEPIPPPNLPGLELLRRERRVENPCPNPTEKLSRLGRAFQTCKKKKLDNDPETIGLFVKPLLCLLCNRCAIDKASNMVAHITGDGHIDMIIQENCDVSQNAIDFWVRAVLRARDSFLPYPS